MSVYVEIFEDFQKGLLTSFYQKMYAELMVYASRLLGAEFAFLAEDCVQNAVYNTFRKKNAFSSSNQWKNHIYICVHNEVMSVLRKGKAKSNYLTTLEEEKEDFLTGIIEQETITMLYDAIHRLPEKYQEVFNMSFVEGMKNVEAAKALGIADVSYKKRKARMLELLRHDLKGENGEKLMMILLMFAH